MPELPEVQALAAFLSENAAGRAITRIDVASFSAVKTVDPPLTALYGAPITGVMRHGKFLDIDVSGLHLITHLSRAGWLQWRTTLPAAPPRPGGKGPIALRIHLSPALAQPADESKPGFDLTEAGTQKRLAVYLVREAQEVPGIARLGPDALKLTEEDFTARLREHSAQVKGALTDQQVLAGIGNAYSDEILHAARLSPFKNTAKLTDEEMSSLYQAMRAQLSDAVARSVGQRAATLKGEKRTGLAVHGRAGLPCPVCGDTVKEVSYASKSFQYCPTCQTEGRGLADRRMSRLLK